MWALRGEAVVQNSVELVYREERTVGIGAIDERPSQEADVECRPINREGGV